MVDPIKIVREWLLGSLEVLNLLGTNANGSIYGGSDLPEHFDPALGPAILIDGTGGKVHPEIFPYTMPVLRIDCVAGVEQYFLARQVFGAVFDTLQGQTNVYFGPDGTVKLAQAAGPGKNRTDPDVGWVIVYEYFSFQITDTSFAANLPALVFDGGTFDADD